MNSYLIFALGLAWLGIVAGGWLGWQLLRQNGRILLRLDELEKRLNEFEFGSDDELTLANDTTQPQSARMPADGDNRANRFANRSLARSKIQRDGLKAGTSAPDFRLPRLDGSGELALSDLRGKRVLLIFSSPDCGPCNALAPELEKFHRLHPDLELVMINKGEPKQTRAKVKEHGLSFPIVMQQQWEISRRYAMFATPITYLIDEAGLIAANVAVGVDGIRELLSQAADPSSVANTKFVSPSCNKTERSLPLRA